MGRRAHTLVLAAFLLAAAAGIAAARGAGEPVLAGPMYEGGVPTSGTTFAGSQRVLARDPAGRLWLAYVRGVDGVDQVFVARSSDGGSTWIEYPRLSDGPYRSSNPAIAIDPTGRPRVTWTRRTAPIAGASEIVEAAKLEEEEEEGEDHEYVRQLFESAFDGLAWSGQLQVTFGRYNGFPSLTFDTAGRARMAWYGFDGDLYQVMYASRADGAWEEPFQVSVGYPDSINPSIAIDGAGSAHVAWYQYSRAIKSWKISYREKSGQTGEWLPQETLSPDLETALNVSVVTDGRSAVHVAWEGKYRDRPGSAVFLRTKAAGAWSLPLVVASPSEDASEPSLAVDPSGRVYVFYQSGADDAVHVAVVEGGAVTSRARVSGSAPGAYPGAAAGPGSGPLPGAAEEAWLAWTEPRSPAGPSAGDNVIRVARVSPAPGGPSPSTGSRPAGP